MSFKIFVTDKDLTASQVNLQRGVLNVVANGGGVDTGTILITSPQDFFLGHLIIGPQTLNFVATISTELAPGGVHGAGGSVPGVIDVITFTATTKMTNLVYSGPGPIFRDWLKISIVNSDASPNAIYYNIGVYGYGSIPGLKY